MTAGTFSASITARLSAPVLGSWLGFLLLLPLLLMMCMPGSWHECWLLPPLLVCWLQQDGVMAQVGWLPAQAQQEQGANMGEQRMDAQHGQQEQRWWRQWQEQQQQQAPPPSHQPQLHQQQQQPERQEQQPRPP